MHNQAAVEGGSLDRGFFRFLEEPVFDWDKRVQVVDWVADRTITTLSADEALELMHKSLRWSTANTTSNVRHLTEKQLPEWARMLGVEPGRPIVFRQGK